MSDRILVTGGAGFIGSHVVDELLEAGHQPCIFDMVASPFHDGAIATDVRGAEVSAARAERELGWTAQTRFAAGASAYLDWYRAQHAEPDPLTT